MDTSKVSSKSYDEVPYPSHPFASTHPDHLFTLGTLFGMQPKLPEEARVLEIGCASAGNLIPIAGYLPGSQCVGIDLSPVQIADGQRTISALGLKNIEITAMSATDFPSSMGKFDYIICHGVFSWVPDFVQSAILKICQDHLADEGIAYISYNTLPGWYMRGMIRGMLRQHVGTLENPTERIQQTRAMLKFMAESTAYQNTPYSTFLKQEVDMLSKHSDQYIYHEHLEENNEPMFFHQFMKLARAAELQFLAESSLASMWVGNLPQPVAKMLTDLTREIVLQGQYMDFVTNRTFRQTLLCRRGRKLNRNIDQHTLTKAYFAADYRLTPEHDFSNLDMGNKVAFTSPQGRTIQTNDPTVKIMAQILSQSFPASLSLPELTERVIERMAATPGLLERFPADTIPNKLCVQLTQQAVGGDVEFRFLPDRFHRQPGEYPKVFDFARQLFACKATVTNRRHTQVNLDGLSQFVLPLIDGRQNRAALIRHVESQFEAGKLTMSTKGDGPLPSAKEIAKSTIDQVLSQFGKVALLEA